MPYGIRLHVWGDYALFTRPEAKAERASYDVMTPSAARGILEAIHWKPALSWIVTGIKVINPMIFDTVRRNEVGCKGSAANAKRAMKSGASLHILVEEERQQRAALVLRHVAYVIEAHFEMTDKAGPGDNEGKHADIFRRRARSGQCFQQPCLGCREFPAFFSLIEREEDMPVSALEGDAPRDLGLMLYDIDFAHGMKPLFYRPRLEKGFIDVARWKRETLCI